MREHRGDRAGRYRVSPGYGMATVLVVLSIGWLLGGCAARSAPPAAVPAPRYPDFLYPEAPPALERGDLTGRLQRGWQLLQAGEARAARRELTAVLRASAGFYPAETALGYVSLAERNVSDAIARFERALKLAPRYLPALVGRGDAQAAAGRLAEARASYASAAAVAPAQPDVRRRLEGVDFRLQQETLSMARQAAEAGRYDEAERAYAQAIERSPESAFLYRELAVVARRQGRAAVALEQLRRAVSLDPGEVRSWVLLADLLEERGEYAQAVDAWTRAQAIEPTEDGRSRLRRLESLAEQARLPAEYRAIAGRAQVTRGDVAALLGVRLSGLLLGSARREATVMTDARAHWAAPWIMTVVRSGVMDAYPNHTFAPSAVVRRLDLAHVISRVLALYGTRHPALVRQWQAARPQISDVPTSHLGYPAVAMAVAAGIMPLGEGRAFKPIRPVTGSELMDVVGRLEGLAR